MTSTRWYKKKSRSMDAITKKKTPSSLLLGGNGPGQAQQPARGTLAVLALAGVTRRHRRGSPPPQRRGERLGHQVGQGDRDLAGAELVAREAQSQPESLCLLCGGWVGQSCGQWGECLGGVESRTSRACSLVRVRGAGDTSGVVLVAHDASLLSNMELSSSSSSLLGVSGRVLSCDDD